MKRTYVILVATTFFALLTMSFGYPSLYFNYLYVACWDFCIVSEPSECDEICNESQPILTPESTTQSTIDSKQKSKQLRELYRPILDEYIDGFRNYGLVLSHGSSYGHPESLDDTLKVDYEYSNGIFTTKQNLEIESPLSQTNNAGKITVIDEIFFPELWVFLVFILGISTFVGFRIRRK